jgi:hypothetical protein
MQRKRNRDCATKVRLTSAHWIGTVEAGGRAQRGAGGWPDGSGSRGQWWPDGSVSNGGLEQWRPVALRHDDGAGAAGTVDWRLCEGAHTSRHGSPRAAAVWGRRQHNGDGELKGGAEWRARTFFGDRCARN